MNPEANNFERRESFLNLKKKRYYFHESKALNNVFQIQDCLSRCKGARKKKFMQFFLTKIGELKTSSKNIFSKFGLDRDQEKNIENSPIEQFELS
ncbi:hypothetical protein BpHYR1_028330 [Brachionus plicatilis]|uniref:Uncharacterized protein n=1 Tax=Brachionus plicatilis TaxID=10195 RepID=A0A3M7R3J9_BRAPC|nr:hypothetical protein BpHYR1_028330 [Brachionus plicatilis]